MPRVAIVANMPTHYRAPVFDLLPKDLTTVVYCSRVEPSRQWQIPELRHRAIFLKESFRSAGNGVDFIHSNREIWSVLSDLRPDVVVVGGLNPTHLYAIAWAKTHGAGTVYMTDGTVQSEANLKPVHRILRLLLLRSFRGHVVTGRGGQQLLASYGIPPARIFVSRLCGPPALESPAAASAREFDVMFCGRIQQVKMPLFFASVCAKVRIRRGRCRALVVGDGVLRDDLLRKLESDGVDATYSGFLPPAHLPRYYESCRLLLFPTSYDPWGLVANEAMSCGTPVITTHAAGCAGDLVVDGANGRVLVPEADAWADAACDLLDGETSWATMSANACRSVKDFNFGAAAAAIQDACERSL
jgi:glycosyltransferase involved in cell wall biosynthesis